MKDHTVNIDGIGPVSFEQSRRARRLTISIRTSTGARVAVPGRTSFIRALEFVHLKKEWIQKNLARMEQHENRRKAFRDALPAIEKADARRKLTDRLGHLAGEHGFTYNNLSFRQQRTRWGSCSHRNNISHNLKLVLLPQELADYVILHELVHTRIHNHAPKFWAELDKYTGDAKAMAKRLRIGDFGLLLSVPLR